jgi:hypothetical protein
MCHSMSRSHLSVSAVGADIPVLGHTSHRTFAYLQPEIGYVFHCNTTSIDMPLRVNTYSVTSYGN